MKKYFAKDLPGYLIGTEKKVKLFLCSRDIQVGDKFIHPVYGEQVCFDKSENGWIRYIEGSEKPETNPKMIFKVLGEISPEATWVKEGDEFDESEIQQEIEYYDWEDIDGIDELFQEFFNKSLALTSTHWEVGLRYHQDDEKTVSYKVFKKRFKIKGSCGHFH